MQMVNAIDYILHLAGQDWHQCGTGCRNLSKCITRKCAIFAGVIITSLPHFFLKVIKCWAWLLLLLMLAFASQEN